MVHKNDKIRFAHTTTKPIPPMIVDVVFDLPVSQKFSYEVPEPFRDAVRRGVRVLVPFGPRKMTGYVVGETAEPPQNIALRAIADVLDTEPMLTEEIFRLAEWIAEYYLCGLGEALRAALPAGITLETRKIAALTRSLTAEELRRIQEKSPLQFKLLTALAPKGGMRIDSLQKRFRQRGMLYNLQKLHDAGLIRIETRLIGRSGFEKREKYVKLTAAAGERLEQVRQSARRQHRVIEVLQALGGSGRYRDVMRGISSPSQVLRSLVQAGIIEVFERRVERDYYGELEVPPAPKLVLNQDQNNAVAILQGAIVTGKAAAFLVHGVTGSGKTQVYIEAIRKTLARGRDAIVLVPEISLTPQTVRRFRSEFQGQVAVMHSRMSNAERYDAWRKIREGRARIVIGPRSAIFAPLPNLGLIVVDEEHDGNYKQSDNSPRYNARDVALVRGKLTSAVVVLGSATPSMESYNNSRMGKYTLIEMKNRIDNIPMPEVTLVNMAKERKGIPKSTEVILSSPLVAKIKEKLERGEQVIILQNRRGYSTAVRCDDCGYVQMCPNCNISMSYHLQGRRMRCHYCNYNEKALAICPSCKSVEIRYRGIGTQRVETHFAKVFPGARIVRMDMDTTRGKRGHDRILQDFLDHKYDILLGTQMIAKGHDFPQVSLVGVISADTGLYLPDFRASERTFQLLTQVAGRAGRKSAQGEVIIQTFSPQHLCLQCAKDHDYKRFYSYEAQDRRLLQYPPFGKLALLQLRHTDESKTLQAAQHLAGILKELTSPGEVLGPSPAPLTRLQNYFRFQILVKGDRRHDPAATVMRQAVRLAMEKYRAQSKYSRVKLTVDIDPVAIL